MKKFSALALAVLLALPLVVPVDAAETVEKYPGPGEKPAIVFNNGEKLTLEGETPIKAGRIFVPVRELTEKFDLHIGYDKVTHSAYILDNANATLAKAEKSETMNLFRNDKKLNTEVVIEDGKSYIPAADFANALGRYYYEDTLSNSLYMFDEAAPMKDGEYVAVGLESRGWAPQVNLTVKDGKIVDVTYNEYNAEGAGKRDDVDYNTRWQTTYPEVSLPERIDTLQSTLLEKQDPNKVDVTTGATGTHSSFVALSKKAIAQAKAANVSKALNFEYRDGKYIVVGITASNGWTPQVDMVVKDGKIVSVEYTAYNQDGASKRLNGADYLTRWTTAREGVDPVAIIAEREAQLIKTQDPNMVDVATGATGWGSDLKILTVGALNQARMADIEVTEDSTIYVFHGAPTYRSAYYVQLLALAKGGEIVDVDYVEYQTGEALAKPHNPAYLERWAERVAEQFPNIDQLSIRQEMLDFFMENKSVEGIDTITGASNWRKGIVDLGPKAVKMIEK